MDAQKLRMDEIHADESFNCRGEINELDVIDLAKDIRAKGLLQPVVVTPYSELKQKETGKKYLLIAGYRRFRSCQILGLEEIDAVIRHNVDEIQARILNLSENLNREQLNIVQEAKAIERLVMFGISRDEIGKQVCKSVGWVQVRTMLLALPKPIWEEAKAGMITQSDIRTLYSIYMASGTDQSVIDEVKRMKDKKLTGKQTRKTDEAKAKPEAKLVRNKTEILKMLYYMQEWLPNSLWSRSMAWCAGEITNAELFESAEEYASELGRSFRPPIEALS